MEDEIFGDHCGCMGERPEHFCNDCGKKRCFNWRDAIDAGCICKLLELQKQIRESKNNKENLA